MSTLDHCRLADATSASDGLNVTASASWPGPGRATDPRAARVAGQPQPQQVPLSRPAPWPAPPRAPRCVVPPGTPRVAATQPTALAANEPRTLRAKAIPRRNVRAGRRRAPRRGAPLLGTACSPTGPPSRHSPAASLPSEDNSCEALSTDTTEYAAGTAKAMATAPPQRCRTVPPQSTTRKLPDISI